ncbi:MAG TPA: hypothetical protein VMK12_01700 [Anaeromyxobacteraceae bacterium]|nr:hypothetical protein [Anaeromyxobacteraceae bacterium]
MSEAMTTTGARDLKGIDGGMLITAVEVSATFTEKAAGSAIDVVRVISTESFRAIHTGLDWIEGANQSSFRIVREAVQGMDKLSQEMVGGLGALSGAMTRVIRGSGEGAAHMILRATESIVGNHVSSRS